jgi:SAM-dependent methyltransferase
MIVISVPCHLTVECQQCNNLHVTDKREAGPIEETTHVIFKSKPLTGIMAEQYFDLATPRHFWCRRRFEVLQRLADGRLRSVKKAAEIGCGNGVLQRQMEDAYDIAPAGFDLHEAALRHNMCRRGEIYCYDIHDRADEFRKAFDLLLMFDVLEHIEDQDRFLQSARFHLADGGFMVINVPALQWLYSPYDRVQGHQRRYSLTNMLEVAKRSGFKVKKATYWGGPLVPILALRKAALSIGKSRVDSYSAGFDSRGELMNSCLYGLSRCEVLPQRIAGTSVMAVLEVAD